MPGSEVSIAPSPKPHSFSYAPGGLKGKLKNGKNPASPLPKIEDASVETSQELLPEDSASHSTSRLRGKSSGATHSVHVGGDGDTSVSMPPPKSSARVDVSSTKVGSLAGVRTKSDSDKKAKPEVKTNVGILRAMEPNLEGLSTAQRTQFNEICKYCERTPLSKESMQVLENRYAQCINDKQAVLPTVRETRMRLLQPYLDAAGTMLGLGRDLTIDDLTALGVDTRNIRFNEVFREIARFEAEGLSPGEAFFAAIGVRDAVAGESGKSLWNNPAVFNKDTNSFCVTPHNLKWGGRCGDALKQALAAGGDATIASTARQAYQKTLEDFRNAGDSSLEHSSSSPSSSPSSSSSTEEKSDVSLHPAPHKESRKKPTQANSSASSSSTEEESEVPPRPGPKKSQLSNESTEESETGSEESTVRISKKKREQLLYTYSERGLPRLGKPFSDSEDSSDSEETNQGGGATYGGGNEKGPVIQLGDPSEEEKSFADEPGKMVQNPSIQPTGPKAASNRPLPAPPVTPSPLAPVSSSPPNRPPPAPPADFVPLTPRSRSKVKAIAAALDASRTNPNQSLDQFAPPPKKNAPSSAPKDFVPLSTEARKAAQEAIERNLTWNQILDRDKPGFLQQEAQEAAQSRQIEAQVNARVEEAQNNPPPPSSPPPPFSTEGLPIPPAPTGPVPDLPATPSSSTIPSFVTEAMEKVQVQADQLVQERKAKIDAEKIFEEAAQKYADQQAHKEKRSLYQRVTDLGAEKKKQKLSEQRQQALATTYQKVQEIKNTSLPKTETISVNVGSETIQLRNMAFASNGKDKETQQKERYESYLSKYNIHVKLDKDGAVDKDTPPSFTTPLHSMAQETNAQLDGNSAGGKRAPSYLSGLFGNMAKAQDKLIVPVNGKKGLEVERVRVQNKNTQAVWSPIAQREASKYPSLKADETSTSITTLYVSVAAQASARDIGFKDLAESLYTGKKESIRRQANALLNSFQTLEDSNSLIIDTLSDPAFIAGVSEEVREQIPEFLESAIALKQELSHPNNPLQQAKGFLAYVIEHPDEAIGDMQKFVSNKIGTLSGAPKAQGGAGLNPPPPSDVPPAIVPPGGWTGGVAPPHDLPPPASPPPLNWGPTGPPPPSDVPPPPAIGAGPPPPNDLPPPVVPVGGSSLPPSSPPPLPPGAAPSESGTSTSPPPPPPPPPTGFQANPASASGSKASAPVTKEAVPPASASSQSPDLLAQIKQGNFNLKKVDTTQDPASKASKNENEGLLAAINSKFGEVVDDVAAPHTKGIDRSDEEWA